MINQFKKLIENIKVYDKKIILDKNSIDKINTIEVGEKVKNSTKLFLNRLPGCTLSIASPEYEEISSTRLKISGGFSNDWDIMGLEYEAIINKIILIVEEINDSVKFDLQLLCNLSISTDGKSVEAVFTMTEENIFKLNTIENILTHVYEFVDIMGNEQNMKGLLPRLPDAINIFNDNTLQTLDISFDAKAEKPTVISFRTISNVIKNWEIVENILTIDNVFADITIRHKPWADGQVLSSFSGKIGGNVKIAKKDFEVSISLATTGTYVVNIISKDGVEMPGLSDILDFAGISGDLPEIGKLSITQIGIGLNLYQKQLMYVYLGARLEEKFLDANFDINVWLPSFSFNGGLAKNSEINLKTLLGKIGISTQDMPEVKITELQLSLNKQDYTFQFEISDDWKIDIYHGHSLSIEKAFFMIDYSINNKAVIYGSICAEMTVADIAFELSADYSSENGWVFKGASTNKEGILLSKFIDDFLSIVGLSTLKNIPNITLKDLEIIFNIHNKEFKFAGESLTKASIPLGQLDYEFDVKVNIVSRINEKTQKREFDGSIGAQLSIGKAVFDLIYKFDSEHHIIKGEWYEKDKESIKITDIIHAFGIPNDIKVPEEIDISLKSAVFEYNIGHHSIVLAAETSYGELFMTAGKSASDEWELIFGIKFPDNWRFSSIPGRIGSMMKPFDFITFEQSFFIVSTKAKSEYIIPALPNHNEAFAELNKNSIQLNRGITTGFIADFGISDNAIIQNLNKILPQSKLALFASIDLEKNDVKVEIDLKGSVTIMSADNGNQLKLGEPKITITTDPSIYLSGSIQIPLGDKVLFAVASLGISTQEAECSLLLKEEKSDGEDASLEIPLLLPGIILDEIGAKIGIVFTPLGVEMGVQGKFHIGNELPKSDEFALAINLEGEIPNPTLFCAHLEELSMEKLIDACINEEQDNLPSFMNNINISDFNIYWSEIDQTLPDGTKASQGFGFNGMIDLFGIDAHACLMVSKKQGIYGDIQFDPIVMNGIEIKGRGKGIAVNQIFKDGKWLTVNKPLPEEELSKYDHRKHQIVKPGGTYLQLNTTHKPYIIASMDVSIFGVVSEKVYVNLENDKFEFEFDLLLPGVFKLTLKCLLDSKDSFSAYSDFKLKLKADIGPIVIPGIKEEIFDLGKLHLDVEADASIYIYINKDEFKMGLSADFEFEGKKISTGRFELDTPLKSLEEIPLKIIEHIEVNIKDLFSHLFNELKDIISKGAKEIEEYSKKAVEEIEKEIKMIEEDTRKEIKVIEGFAEAEIQKIEKEIKTIEVEIVKISNSIAEETKKIVHEAEILAKSIINEAHDVAAKIEKQVEGILREIEKYLNKIAEEIKEKERALEKMAKSVWHRISKY